PPPSTPLFPYTTLFRSLRHERHGALPPRGQLLYCPSHPPRKRGLATAVRFRSRRLPRVPLAPDLHSPALGDASPRPPTERGPSPDRKSTRLNSSHDQIS